MSIRSIFLILLPLFASGLWLTNYNNTTNTLSVSIILRRRSIHAKLIKVPHVHSESYSYAKNNDLLLHFLTIFHVVVFWSYILILMSGDVEINPGPLSVDLSTSTESSMSYMDVSLFENNFSIVHYCYVPGVTRRLRKPTSWLASNKLCLKFNKSI